ncbi:hypothetical protein T492DRAFT_849550 [Pavlovales sp. CCMP2436]|nr:hypothetical protein T492DRAFT_849550 [Pavlovales sp. CCMP2436]
MQTRSISNIHSHELLLILVIHNNKNNTEKNSNEHNARTKTETNLPGLRLRLTLGMGHADEFAAISHAFVDLGNVHVGVNFHMGDKRHPNHIAPGFRVPVRVQQVVSSHSHVCVIMCEGTVKCFGSNSHGQLGYGDTLNRGFSASEMGDNLPTVKLGHDPWINTPSGRGHYAHAQVIQLSAGGGSCSPRDWPYEVRFHVLADECSLYCAGLNSNYCSTPTAGAATCAVDSNYEARCWGDNTCGQLPHPPTGGECSRR